MDKNEHRKRIGKQLADLRKERGLSGEQLAEKIGKCHQTVYKVERGAWAVSVDILEEFCDALDAELVVRKKEAVK
jgi:transcriptional regulator with XRE-family HTH domain